MVDNISLGPEAGINHNLALLRAAALEKAITPRTDLVPGVFLSVDPEAVVEGKVSSAPGEMLKVDLSPRGPVRWMSLHAQMGVVDLRQVTMLGVVCRSVAPQSVTCTLTLRSGVDGGFVDTGFRKTLVCFGEPSVHLDVIDLAREAAIPRDAVWRELILMFEHARFDATLLNLGMFTV